MDGLSQCDCGGEAKVVMTSLGYYLVKCDKCGKMLTLGNLDKLGLIIAWNLRQKLQKGESGMNMDWISTKDRLPDESDGTVIVCMPNVFPYNSLEHFVNAKHDGRVISANYSQFSKRWFFDGAVSDVIPEYWMPKPIPPQE